MKTMKNFLSMAALALVGAMMTGCSNDDNIISNQQQPENKSNLVTLTTTVGFDEDIAATRAVTGTGVKTFAVGDKMAISYNNTSGQSVKAVSAALTSDDIASGGKSATFTFTLDSPDKTKAVSYVYPAAMLNDDFTVNWAALNNQNGTLATIGSNLDYCWKQGSWDGENLPTLTLENQIAILAINLKNGSTDITSTITGMTISDGTNTYTVSRSAAAGPIYVAIHPVTSPQNIEVTATDGTNEYVKTLSGKTYAANNGYNVTWNMSKKTTITWNSTNVFNDSHEDDMLNKSHMTPLTYEGITISFSGTNYSIFSPYTLGMGAVLLCYGGEGDSFTFTAPSGKKFTKIEIISNSDIVFTAYGDWTQPENTKIVWSGTAANAVTLGGSNDTYTEDLNSIVFTLKDE